MLNPNRCSRKPLFPWKGPPVAIQVTCQSCGTSLRVKNVYAGRRGQCPRCQAPLQVPNAPEAVPLPPDLPPPQDTAPADRPAAELMQLILGAFQGDVPRVRRTAGYHLGILCVTGAMLLLPVLYVGLIALVILFLVLHAAANGTFLQHVGAVYLVIFIYFGPLIAGTILVFFMLKPLLARPPRARRGRALAFGREPVLFAFVTRIARAVGAPEPRRIEIDCEVNASASFGRGLAALVGRDLTLTLGLPLLAGLTVQQLAGVLAHELGHFSQGAGMRLWYVIRSINGWFERAVHERDSWDETLAEWCRDSGRLALIFFLAQISVGLTRGVLWLFLLLSHTLSCYLSRQMEYDADRFQVRLAGPEAFEATFRRMVVLGLAAQEAFALVLQSWVSDRYPEDLSAVVVALADRMPAKLCRRLHKALAQEKTGLFDTHPCFADRVANVRREHCAGVFHLDRPAADLFQDLPRLARNTSLDLYRGLFGKKLKRDKLLPAAAFLGDEAT